MFPRFAVPAILASALLPFSAGTVVARERIASEPVPIFESSAATVAGIVCGNAADAVVVGAGYDRDFCTGARCVVERDGVPVAEIVIADADRSRAVALITYLEKNNVIQTGDTVKLKIL